MFSLVLTRASVLQSQAYTVMFLLPLHKIKDKNRYNVHKNNIKISSEKAKSEELYRKTANEDRKKYTVKSEAQYCHYHNQFPKVLSSLHKKLTQGIPSTNTFFPTRKPATANQDE